LLQIFIPLLCDSERVPLLSLLTQSFSHGLKDFKRFSSIRSDTDFILPYVANFAFMERTREACGSLAG
jgi:hypothetical protein